jgi:molybdate transport system ATP-binding protein
VTLDADFTVRRPEHTTKVALAAVPGEVIGLIGPNGAGKSTTLRALAGLVQISEGHIVLEGRELSGPRIHVPANERRIGFVFQDHLLFPHLSALDNVAFGPQARGSNRRQARATALEWLGRLSIQELSARRPRELSGGQAQRVAIARALASDPQLLLLDEPTASLDASGAMSLRTQLREHLRRFEGVSIVVTHTALDAMVLADRLVVLDDGVIVQTGAPSDIAAHPRTPHAAALVGLNFMQGRAQAGVLASPGGARIVAAEPLNGPAYAAFSPTAVSLYVERPSGSPRNVWHGRVESLTPHGDAVRVQLDTDPPILADVTPAALAALHIEPGSRLWASVKATEVSLYQA